MNRFLSTAKDHRIPAFDAQRGGVAGDVGTALVEEQNHADGHAAFFDAQAIRTDIAFDRLTDRIDLLRDLLDAGRHRFDALFVQLQSLDERPIQLRRFGGGGVLVIGLEQGGAILADRLRDALNRRNSRRTSA